MKFASYAMYHGRRLALEYVRREKAGGVRVPANRWVEVPVVSLDAPCGGDGALTELVAARDEDED